MTKVPVPNKFQIQVKRRGEKDLSKFWIEEYSYEGLDTDKDAVAFFKKMIATFNKDARIRGNNPRTLVAVKRKYIIVLKNKKKYAWHNIWRYS